MTKGIKTVLWDCDILVYRCGFASKEHEPLSYTLQSVKTVLENVNANFPEATEFKLFLTGSGNYRDNISTTRVYKGNRDPQHRPEYYDEIRQYLIEYCGAVVVEGKEADDQLGIEQWKHKDKSSVIVTIDKDLDCIPGWHYNWVKKVLYYQTIAEANKAFWTQVLTGDTTDNIRGIPKVGPKTAAKIIATSDGTWTDMWVKVLQEYRRYYGDVEGDNVFHEMATLTWMQRVDNVNYDSSLIVVPEEHGDDDIPF